MHKVSTVCFYVLAGFFVYGLGIVGFMRAPDDIDRAAFVAVLVGVCSVPLAVLMLIGFALSRFRTWKRDLGVVLISGVGFTAMVALSIGCMLFDSQGKKMFPPDFEQRVDVAMGIGVNLVLLLLGIGLLLASRASAEPAPPQAPDSAASQPAVGADTDGSNPYRPPLHHP